MRVLDEKIKASVLEKFFVFGAQLGGKPVIIQDGTQLMWQLNLKLLKYEYQQWGNHVALQNGAIVIKYFQLWRVIILVPIILSIVLSYIGFVPDKVSVALLLNGFLALGCFFWLGEIYLVPEKSKSLAQGSGFDL